MCDVVAVCWLVAAAGDSWQEEVGIEGVRGHMGTWEQTV